MNKLKYLLLFSSLVFSLSLTATPVDSLFTAGNQAYNEGKYEAAVNLYNQIVNKGYEGAVLYYNLGNAYFKSQEISKALLWYERAHRLSPQNEDIIHNIAFANQQIVDKIEVLPQLFIVELWNNLSRSLTPNTWAILSIVFSCLLMFSLALFLISARHWLRSLSLSLLFVSFIFLLFSVGFARKETLRYQKNPEAIIVYSVVNAKSTPTESGGDLFVIHEGLKVVITDQLNDWNEIKLPNGEKGWVKSESLEII